MPQCLYQSEYNGVPCPCGKCMYCRRKRVSGWSARLINKERNSSFAFFVTLTYAPEHLMFCPNNRPTLYPSHLTAFWKRFRKAFPPKTISYYVAGEYGSNRQRPHYHAIVFFNSEKIEPVRAFNELHNHWKYGDIHVGTVTEESIAYTLKYISKKPSVPQYKGDTRTREFSRMSKGLGADYLTESAKKWHLQDLTGRCYLPTLGGGKSVLSRYYKDKLYTKEQRKLIAEYMADVEPTRHAGKAIELRKISERELNA